MTVYVDNMNMQAKVGRLNAVWCHMWADTEEELHAFAARLGMRRGWFQGPPQHTIWHYDITAPKRRLAVRLGAVEVDMYSTRETHPALIERHRK